MRCALTNAHVSHLPHTQAAVLDAQAWLGSSGALMGRSHLVGPNPYALLNLLPGGRARGRTPRLQTPYQVDDACTPAGGCLWDPW